MDPMARQLLYYNTPQKCQEGFKIRKRNIKFYSDLPPRILLRSKIIKRVEITPDSLRQIKSNSFTISSGSPS